MFSHPIGFFSGAPRSVSQVIISANGIATAHNAWVEIWTDVSGSPGVQIGGDSDSVFVDSDGDKTFTWTGAEPIPLDDFWVALQVDGGDVNYDRELSGSPDAGVTGGDFDTTAITNLVSTTSNILNAEVTFSDSSTAGQFSTNSVGGMSDVNFAFGTLIQHTP